jgi:putative transposase
MARILFTVGVRYKLRGEVFVVRQILVGGKLQVENQSFGGVFVVPVADLVAAWGADELIFEVPAALARTNTSEPLGTDYTYADFQSLPAPVQAESWRRYQIILPLMKMSSRQRTREAVEAYIAGLCSLSASDVRPSDEDKERKGGRVPLGTALSRSSALRWMAAFTQSGLDIRALVPNLEGSARKGESRIDQEVEQILRAVLAELGVIDTKRTGYDVYLMVINRIAEENRTRPTSADKIAHPALRTVQRRIEVLRPELLKRRRSRLEAQADALVGDGPEPTRVLERVEMDNTLLDLFVVDEEDRLPIGRPLLIYALDVYSGLPCGFYIGFEPASAFTASACTYHSIMPKPDVQQRYGTTHPWPVFGLMETLVIDNGKDFINADLKAACGQLGILLEQMPVRTPWFKGSVERFFRTNNTRAIASKSALLSRLSGV